MNRSISHLMFAAATVMLSVLAANPSHADDYHSINSQASIIRSKTSVLLGEVRQHYRGTPNFDLLCDDVNEIKRLSEHIRQLARRRVSLDYLAADLAELDAQFHHLENLFDVTELEASRGNGYIKGSTAHVKRLLCAIEDCIHHIRRDVDSIRLSLRPVHKPIVVHSPVVKHRRQPYSGKTYGGHRSNHYGHGHHGHRQSGVGISIGGGRTQFHFRF